MQSLMRFLYPTSLENPDSTGRLELFARFGPTDEEGQLRGGPNGAHVHTNLELAQMASHACREALFACFVPKPRSSVEAIVDALHKVAMAQRYSKQEVRQILRDVAIDQDGRMNFTAMQDVILATQQQRLQALHKRAQAGLPVAAPKEAPPRVLFQSKSAAQLMQLTQNKKASAQEEQLQLHKRMHSYSSLVAGLEQQNQSLGLRANVTLVRSLGDVHDRWDRYCAVRRTGRSTYVGAKNLHLHADHPRLDERFNPSMDDGLTNKYPGVASLLAASASGSSAAVQLAT